MTTFRWFALLVLASMPVSSHSAAPKAFDAVMSVNASRLNSSDYFLTTDAHFYYLGFRLSAADQFEAEFLFLTRFKDELDGIFTVLCAESSMLLKDNNQYQFNFSKNTIVEDRSHLFLATISTKVIFSEKKKVCM
tara:strand:+ start:187 stop:591 length:405 start_codon:yes stop_codon:yes gene_type:complete